MSSVEDCGGAIQAVSGTVIQYFFDQPHCPSKKDFAAAGDVAGIGGGEDLRRFRVELPYAF
jgi:hypothetical protein